jgi:acetyltransferase-like isoleucine patch superfamily enzyme
MTRRPVAKKNSNIDSKARVGNGAQIVNSTIGKYSYVYESRVINTTIGRYCSIAAGCTIGGGKHPVGWVSTSPVFYSGHNVFHKNFSHNVFDEFAETHIGNDVWIGSRCLIKGGVTIGDGAIVGMGSVVTHDIPPYEIWAGNPARLIRKRFDEKTIEKLSEIQWWNWDDEKIQQEAKYFNDVEVFILREDTNE